MSRRTLILPVLLALTAGLSSCIVLVGAGAGYVASQTVLANEVHTAEVLLDVETVWAGAQETVMDLAIGDVEILEYPRRVRAEIDGADVEVEVDAYDLNRTLVRVEARRLLAPDGDLAREILDRILEDLGAR